MKSQLSRDFMTQHFDYGALHHDETVDLYLRMVEKSYNEEVLCFANSKFEWLYNERALDLHFKSMGYKPFQRCLALSLLRLALNLTLVH